MLKAVCQLNEPKETRNAAPLAWPRPPSLAAPARTNAHVHGCKHARSVWPCLCMVSGGLMGFFGILAAKQ